MLFTHELPPLPHEFHEFVFQTTAVIRPLDGQAEVVFAPSTYTLVRTLSICEFRLPLISNLIVCFPHEVFRIQLDRVLDNLT